MAQYQQKAMSARHSICGHVLLVVLVFFLEKLTNKLCRADLSCHFFKRKKPSQIYCALQTYCAVLRKNYILHHGHIRKKSRACQKKIADILCHGNIRKKSRTYCAMEISEEKNHGHIVPWKYQKKITDILCHGNIRRKKSRTYCAMEISEKNHGHIVPWKYQKKKSRTYCAMEISEKNHGHIVPWKYQKKKITDIFIIVPRTCCDSRADPSLGPC